MSKQPLLIMLLVFCFGIFSQDYFSWDIWVSISVLVVSFLGLILLRFKIEILVRLKNYLLGFFFFGLGLFCHWQNSIIPDLPKIEKPKQMVVFQLKKKLNSNKKNRRYEIEILKVQSLPSDNFTAFLSIVNIPKDQSLLDFEHYYQAEVYINPIKKTSADFQFDYYNYLSRQGIYFQTYIKGDILSESKLKVSLSDLIKQKRLATLVNINQSSLHPRNKEFLKGIILADRTEMDAEMVQDFGKSGLMHFLAISGSHMAIIFWLILIIIKPIFSYKNRKLPIIITLILIWMFAIFIDYGSSVVRSCIMVTMYYMMVILQRKPDLLHSMAVSAFIILIVDTQQLYDVGFQLSYLAVFGIYWLNPIILEKFRKPKYKLETLFYSIVSISLSAQLATLPLVLYYFHQFSVVSIIANLVVLPFSEVVIIFSIIMVILYSFNIYWGFVDVVYDFFIDWLLKLIHFFASADSFYHDNISFGLVEVLICLLGFYYLRGFIQKFTYKNIINLSFVILLFFGVRILINFYYARKDEVVLVENFKDKILIIKEKEQVLFIIRDSIKEEYLRKSVINPYLTARRVRDYKVISTEKGVTTIIYNKRKYNLDNDRIHN